MRRKKVLTLLCVALAALAVVRVAAGAWSISSSGNGAAKALLMPAGAAPTKSVSYPNIALSWSAVTVGGAAVDSYTVRRYTEAGVLQSIASACSGAIAATTCTENSVPVGRWQYTTQPVKGGWTGAESAKSVTAEIAAAPTGVSCTNCTTFSSTKYINNAGKLAVNLQVTLAASSLSTDTVHLTLTDSASTTVTATAQAATAGAGTVTFTALNTSTLVDGNITATAWVTTNTSDSSANATTTLVRDVVAPTASDIFGTNGPLGTARKIDTAGGDTLVYTFSEPMDPTSIQAGWSGGSTTVNPSIVGGDMITAATALGVVSTGAASYVQTGFTVNCSTTTMVMSGSTITLDLNNCLPTSRLRVGTATQTFAWTPSALATDQAGNPMSTTVQNEVGGPKANF
jgi:hypothetical protein